MFFSVVVLPMLAIRVQASLISTPIDARNLLPRQFVPPSIPPQCSSTCDAALNGANSCETSADYVSCVCSQAEGQAIVACGNCIVTADPSVFTSVQTLLEEYVTTCSGIPGITFSPPLSITPPGTTITPPGTTITPPGTTIISPGTTTTSNGPIPSASGGSPSSTSRTATGPAPTTTIDATNPDIKYSGNWADRTASCLIGSTTKQCQGAGNSLSYTFNGTEISMKIGENKDSGKYDVDLDGVVVHNDSFSSASSPICDTGFIQKGMVLGLHTIKVNSLGASSHASSSSQGTFELVNFVVVRDSSTVPGGPSGCGPTQPGVNSLFCVGFILVTIMTLCM